MTAIKHAGPAPLAACEREKEMLRLAFTGDGVHVEAIPRRQATFMNASKRALKIKTTRTRQLVHL